MIPDAVVISTRVMSTELPAVSLSCVISVAPTATPARRPSLEGAMRARKTKMEIWSLDQTGADAGVVGLNGSPTRVVKIFKPKIIRECEKIVVTDEQSLNSAAERLVKFLTRKRHIRDVTLFPKVPGEKIDF